MATNTILFKDWLNCHLVFWLFGTILNPAQDPLLLTWNGEKLFHAAAMNLGCQSSVVALAIEGASQVISCQPWLTISHTVGEIQIQQSDQIADAEHDDGKAERNLHNYR